MATAQDYCGIVFIGGGSSWAYAATPEAAAKAAAKQCAKDWSGLFGKFSKVRPLRVNILDMRAHDGWSASTCGGIVNTKGETIPVMCVIEQTP